MTDWDARAEELAREKATASARQRQERMANERAKREKAGAVRSKLVDVTSWAIARYQAARISLLPVYVEWEEEVKPMFKKARKEGRRLQIGQVYPLRSYYQYHEGGDYSGPSETRCMWAATEDKRIFDIPIYENSYLGGYRGLDKQNITEITCQRQACSENWQRLGIYFREVAPPISGESYIEPISGESYIDENSYGIGFTDGLARFPGDHNKNLELDAICDSIAEYVRPHTDPENPPTYF